MNKKLLTMTASLALVGAVGIGSTLAYLSDKTKTLTNTFTVGNNIEMKLTETDVNNDGKRIEATNSSSDQLDYGQMDPGEVKTKDPRVDLGKTSNDAYTYISVQGLDDLYNTNIEADDTQTGDFVVVTDGQENTLSSQWKKVANADGSKENLDLTKDGVYVYVGAEGTNPVIVTAGNSTDSLFDQVKVADHVTSFAKGAELNDIVLKAAAVQASSNTSGDTTDATNAAIDLLTATNQNKSQ